MKSFNKSNGRVGVLRDRWSFVQFLGCLAGVLLFAVSAFSQGSTGRILGTVTDQSGGVVAGATVTVIDTERGVSRTLTTDDAGAYNAPNLTPGNYTVRAEAKGFKKLDRQNVVVEVGHEVRVDLTVQPGEQSQTVTVTESVPLVETTNATMGGTLENSDIADLPLNGRDYQNLMALRPGVQLYPGGGPWTQSTNGVRADESVWMVDGVINVNPFDARPITNMPSPFTDAATILPIDAIQEFNLMENPKAEYGWNAGAIVNVGIKSGTNTLHGSAYAFGRKDSWDARNYYNLAPLSNGSCPLSSVLPSFCNKTPVQLKQYGGNAGGKILKDKLFWFGGYEGLRDAISVPFSIPIPATASIGNPSLSMVDAINAVGAASLTPSPVSLKLLCPNAVGQALPLPSSFVCTGGFTPATGTSTNFLSNFPIINDSDNGVGKMDYHLNQKNQITGMLFVSVYNAIGEDRPFTNPLFEASIPIKAWTNVESWVYTPNSSTVNEMRFGYNRLHFDTVNVDVNRFANGTDYPIDTGVTIIGGMPTVHIAGFSAGGADILGINNNRPQLQSPNPVYDFQDSVSLLKGNHAFKFGGEFAHMEADTATYVDGRGTINFNGGATPQISECNGVAGSGSCALEDFFAGNPSNGILQIGNPLRAVTSMMFAGYVQDDFHATRKLMINLGLRYEYNTPMMARNGLFGNFLPTAGLVQQGAAGMQSLWSGDHRGFEPRLGFAYDITGKGTTVVRAGAGIVRSTWPLETIMNPQGLQNDNAVSPAGVPTSAALVCSPGFGGESGCPATPGGTNSLGVANTNGPQLNWNGVVFPSAGGLTCGDGVTVGSAPNPGPCDVLGINQNLKHPFIVNYNLGVQHQIGNNLSIDVAYVGNRGYRLLNYADINQAPVGAGWCLNALTAAQAADACGPNRPSGCTVSTNPLTNTCAFNLQAAQEARPFFTRFPYIGFINQLTNRGYSNYNSMQLTITKRMSHGLSFTTGYTYAHGLDNGSLNREAGLPQDSAQPDLEYGNSDTDIRHRLTATATYNIPGIKGYGQLLEGWQINGIYSYSTPQPWIAFDPNDQISGTGENADRWNIVGSPLAFPSGKNSNPFCKGTFNGSSPAVNCGVVNPYGTIVTPATQAQITGCLSAAGSPAGVQELNALGCYPSVDGTSFIVPPVRGTFGNMGRNTFRDSGFSNLDMSIFKNFKFRERYGVQFRWEVFNAFNHPIVANPWGSASFLNSGNALGSGGFGATGATPDVGYGNPLIGSGSARDMQLGLKLTF